MFQSIYKIIYTVCIIIGAIIGAGFASGREILLFFCNCEPIRVLITGVIFSSLVFMLLLLNSKLTPTNNIVELNNKVGGKFGKWINILILVSCFVTLAAMFAAGSLSLSQLFNNNKLIPVMAIATAAVSFLLLINGMTALKVLNILAVPLLIVFIILICSQNQDAEVSTYSGNSFFRVVSYFALNIISLYSLLATIGKQLSFKQILVSSIISGLIICILIYFVLTKLSAEYLDLYQMPMLSLAYNTSKFIYVFGVLVMYLAIITTLTSCAYPLVNFTRKLINNNIYSVAIIMAAGASAGMLSFSFIIDYLYPCVAVVGGIVLILSIIAHLRSFPKIKLLKHRDYTRSPHSNNLKN